MDKFIRSNINSNSFMLQYSIDLNLNFEKIVQFQNNYLHFYNY